MNKQELTVKIQTALIGSKYWGVDGIEEYLEEITGHKAEWYDTDIDDGADDDETEDTYVMKACFEIADINTIVRVYYGDVTKEIGYVQVSVY